MKMAVALLWLAASPGRCFLHLGAKQTVGTNNYSGTSAFADFGGDWHFKPAFSTYHSNISSGTYNTISGRLAYDEKLWGAGVTLGGSPQVNGYSNRFFGVDGVVSLTPTGSGSVSRLSASEEGAGKPTGKGVARVDLGGGLTHTTHIDRLQASGKQRAAAVNIGQIDFNGFAGLSILDNLATLDITKSVYDKDLAAISARAGRVVRLAGLLSIASGFPDTNVSLKVENSFFPLATPFVSYTRTTYVLGLPSSNAFALGAYAEFDVVEVSASYQRITQTGQTDQNLVSFGATLRF